MSPSIVQIGTGMWSLTLLYAPDFRTILFDCFVPQILIYSSLYISNEKKKAIQTYYIPQPEESMQGVCENWNLVGTI